MRRSLIVVIAGGVFATGCAEAPVELPVIAQRGSAIINGSVDNSGNYEDVVAMFTSVSKCTATIVAKQEPYAFVLTAAHCVDDNAPMIVIQGVDHDAPSAIQYNVQDYLIHPGYNQSVNDFAMIRIVGAGPSTPTRAVLTPAEDNLTNGTPVTHLGYGVIDTGPNPDTGTSQRNITTGTVISTSSLTITFDASSSGVCFGDSGGPNIHNATGKVAGVNSAVAGNSCNTQSFSGRASAVLDSFITPYINNAPPPPVDCDGCFEAATTGSGSCIGAVNTCLNDSACGSLVSCFNGCNTQSCINTCSQTYAAAVPLYNAIFSCVCDSACMTECENASMCTTNTPPPTTSSIVSSSIAADAAAATAGAGGGGVGGMGAGATDPSSGSGENKGWVPGDAEDENIQGNLLSTACTLGDPRSHNDWAWLLLSLAGIGAARRRRNPR